MENRKRIILIGRSAAGKTTLCQFLNHEAIRYHKTQTVQLMGEDMIDTPGEYLERRAFRGALMVSAVDADVLILVQAATEDGTMFPPMFAANFTKPAIGIVTKSDIATAEQSERAGKYLKLAGAKEVYITSSVKGTGFSDLLVALGYEEESA